MKTFFLKKKSMSDPGLPERVFELLRLDDAENLEQYVKENHQDIHYAHHVYKYHEDFQETFLSCAILTKAVRCVAWLKEQGVDVSSRLCVARANFVVGDGDDDEIRVDEVDYTPLQLATVLHGRESNVAQVLRSDKQTLLRRGFDCFYYRVLRKAYAPGENAAKRACLVYERDCQIDGGT